MGSSTCRSASASGCSCAATSSGASSPAWSSCRATASTPRTRRKIEEILQRGVRGRQRRVHDAASPSRCWPACTSSSTRSPARCPTTTSARSRRAWPRPRARGPTTSATRSSSTPARSAADALLGRYGDAFPAAYRDDFAARQRCRTTSSRIEALASAGRPRRSASTARWTATRRPAALQGLSAPAGRAALGRAAVLENMGVRGQRRAALRAAAARTGRRLDLRLRPPARPRRRARRRRGRATTLPGRLRARLAAARPRTTASTGWSCGAAHRARGHGPAGVRQVPAPGGHHVQPGVHGADALAAHPDDRARRWSSCSRLRLRPGASGRRGRAGDDRSRTGSPASIDGVASLDEDRILRGFLAPGPRRRCARTTTRRTPTGGAKPYLSLKLDPARVPDLPAAAADVRDLRATRPASRASTCAAARSRAAASAGRTGARTSAPRSSA